MQVWESWFSLGVVTALLLYAYQRGLMGGADVKLMGLLVVLFGWGPEALSTQTLVWGHAWFVLAVLLRPVLPARLTATRWPFIPFLFLGYLCAWAWHVNASNAIINL